MLGLPVSVGWAAVRVIVDWRLMLYARTWLSGKRESVAEVLLWVLRLEMTDQSRWSGLCEFCNDSVSYYANARKHTVMLQTQHPAGAFGSALLDLSVACWSDDSVAGILLGVEILALYCRDMRGRRRHWSCF